MLSLLAVSADIWHLSNFRSASHCQRSWLRGSALIPNANCPVMGRMQRRAAACSVAQFLVQPGVPMQAESRELSGVPLTRAGGACHTRSNVRRRRERQHGTRGSKVGLVSTTLAVPKPHPRVPHGARTAEAGGTFPAAAGCPACELLTHIGVRQASWREDRRCKSSTG